MAIKKKGNDQTTDLPEYLKRWPGLYMRQDDRIVEALPEDIDVARSYPTLQDKGPVQRGRRITIMCRKRSYLLDEEVRIIHVLEVLEPGQEIFVMGPKMVYGEYVDGRAVTAASGDKASAYDGAVLKSPGVDFNYDISSYRFDTPGRHTICWKMGKLRSNTLELEIELP